MTKGFLTLVARIWPRRGVDSLMFNEPEALPEQFLTFVTFIWPHPCVSSLRPDTIGFASKGFSKLSTLKDFLHCEVYRVQ